MQALSGSLGTSVQIPPIRVPLPDGALDIPFSHERILHYEAGLYLDRLMRPLARVSGSIDRALALRLSRVRRRSDYKRVGCARFADYAREHLGLAVRTAQEMVRLGKGLERLPLLDAALADGRITWTGALQVARVAGKEDEAHWVSLAEQLSVRELRKKVVEALVSGNDSEPGRPVKDEGEDSDPVQRLSVSCAWSVARLWHAAVELCGVVVGGPLAAGEAAVPANWGAGCSRPKSVGGSKRRWISSTVRSPRTRWSSTDR